MFFACRATADDFGKWKMNREANDGKGRAECVYEFDTTDGKKGVNTVLRYPVDDPKVGWDYFANSEGKVWAKCMNKRNPKFDADKMQWALCNPDGSVKEMLKKGDCPTPKGGKNQITKPVPDPVF
jgi:hypothetical protein